MADTESPINVICTSDDTPDSDGVYVSEAYLQLLLTLAYPNKPMHCGSCRCSTDTGTE